jgi:hypothetical protein
MCRCWRAQYPTLAVSKRLRRGDPPVHLSKGHAAREVPVPDPQALLLEHDAR